MWDEGPQRAVILVRQSTPMGCQILTIGAAGQAPVGLIFHCLPPQCLKQQKRDHQKLSLVPSVSFPVTNTSQLCVPLHQHTSPITHTWRQQLEAKGYLNNKNSIQKLIPGFFLQFQQSLEAVWPMSSWPVSQIQPHASYCKKLMNPGLTQGSH